MLSCQRSRGSGPSLLRQETVWQTSLRRVNECVSCPYVLLCHCQSQGVPHGVISPVCVGEWLLPPGTLVMPLQWAVNRDPALWSLPDTFRPARFIQSDGKLRPDHNILPFQVRETQVLSRSVPSPAGGEEEMSGGGAWSLPDLAEPGKHLPTV